MIEPGSIEPVAGNGLLHRRVFLRSGLVLGSALAASGEAAAAPPADAAPPFSGYGQPSRHEGSVVRRAGPAFRPGVGTGNGVAWSPLAQLEGTITPNALHFVRNHGGTPDIDPAQHRLLIHGLVRQPLAFDVAALVRYPQRSALIFLECGGNSSAGWFAEPVERPVSVVHGLLSCSEWTGVPLSLLLDEAGVDARRARWIIASGADAGSHQMSLPLAKAMDDCLVALYQNGERLRPENGYPMRLIAPGWKGVVNVKWLRGLQLAEQPAMSRNETSRYTELLPSGKARQFTFAMDVKSVIVTPSHGQTLPAPDIYEVRGLAWSGAGRIRKVEVSADAGKTWAEAALQEPVLPRCLTRFRAAWKWDGQRCVLQSRATDETGAVQPTRAALVGARGRAGSYHYNAIVSWEVDGDGTVTHVYA